MSWHILDYTRRPGSKDAVYDADGQPTPEGHPLPSGLREYVPPPSSFDWPELDVGPRQTTYAAVTTLADIDAAAVTDGRPLDFKFTLTHRGPVQAGEVHHGEGANWWVVVSIDGDRLTVATCPQTDAERRGEDMSDTEVREAVQAILSAHKPPP